MLDTHPPKTGLMTVDEFLEWVNLPENTDKRWELIEGVPVEMPPSSKINTVIEGIIITFLNYWVMERKLGYVSVPDGGYRISSKSIFQPDVGYISKARAGGLDGTVFENSPDLAVEVVSPSENEKNTFIKAHRYLLNGTHIVWVVYPDDKVVYVCTLEANTSMNVQMFDETMTLTGGDVLPNFKLEVAKIFPDDE
jgi:Uma2 family endonuclease